MRSPVSVAIHGGCGTPAEHLLSPEDWRETQEHLANALRDAWHVLRAGGRAIDAVEVAVVVMEDSPHFNAGHGAALTEASTHELDASIMDGSDLRAGAVCTVKRVRNPIRAARAVMDRTECVLLAAQAADDFAARCGLVMVEPEYFTTPRRLAALASLKARGERGTLASASESERHGTVGAVALDATGNLAAATSTGGFNNKPQGRVGDSPIIGAGTYARNGVCAVSCTGQGESFIRNAVAFDLAARMRYQGQSLPEAAEDIMNTVIAPHGIGAGLVALDAAGRVIAPFNTLGMARGWISPEGEAFVATHHALHRIEL